MRIDLEFVELHSPLFIDGMNFGLKLYADPKKAKAPIKLYYDTDGTGKWTNDEKVIVEYKDKIAILDTVASRTVATAKPIVIKTIEAPRPSPVIKAQVSGPGQGLKISAQVETPMDKVQGGQKRRPKYQGEESQGE